jgi:hypothetical protein
VLANPSGTTVSADVAGLEDWSRAELLIGNYPEMVVDKGIVEKLRPWECVVYRRAGDMTEATPHTTEP